MRSGDLGDDELLRDMLRQTLASTGAVFHGQLRGQSNFRKLIMDDSR